MAKNQGGVDQGRRAFLHKAGILFAVGALEALGGGMSGCGIDLSPQTLPPSACETELKGKCICGDIDVGFDTKVYFEYTAGDPNLPTLVCCHGYRGSYMDAYFVIPTGTYPILTYSHPGHARSGSYPREHGNTIPTAAEGLEKVLAYARKEAIISGNNEVLVGFSMGGFVVSRYYATHPEEKRGAIIINSQDTPVAPSTTALFYGQIALEMMSNPFKDYRVRLEYIASIIQTDSSMGTSACGNPWLLITCEEDTLIFPQDVKAMAERLGCRARFYKIPWEGHVPSENGLQQMRCIIDDNIDFLMRKE